jgi:predicted DsbA family dithiol-disulfide isomerase
MLLWNGKQIKELLMNQVLNEMEQRSRTLIVDIVSDLICPWCYIAKRRVEKTAALLNQEIGIRWWPFELNANMPIDGLDRRTYRSAKFGSWAQSLKLDAQVADAGQEVGLMFRHDLMRRTPNTFRGHILLAAALKDGLIKQNKVAERLFQAYFINGEDLGDPVVLLGIAREFDVLTISRMDDFDNRALADEVTTQELQFSATVRGVAHISFDGQVLANSAQREDFLASAILDIQNLSGQCKDGVCGV